MILLKYQKYIIVVLGLFLLGCDSEKKSESPVLVRVDDQYITRDEFISRSEYTIRPEWCRGENYVHRKIALNSLIAEKLLAIEAGLNTPIDNDPDIHAYLKGRKEQEMRQLNYQRTAVDKVTLNQETLNTVLENSERTYQVEIIPIGDDGAAAQIGRDLAAQNITFSEIKEKINGSGGTIQDLELRFDSPLDDVVYKALFHNKNIQKGQVIGPLQLDENAYTLVRINGWSRRPLLSSQDQKLRLKDIREKETRVAAMDIYVDWVRKLMHSKRLDFNKDVLISLIKAVGPIYFEAREKSDIKMQKNFWNIENKDHINIKDVADKVDALKSEPLLEIDGQVWTVGRFEEELKIHPLVFRNPKMSKRQFGEQFRLAIADMVRDRYITAYAYDKEYDKDKRLQHQYKMWVDNLKAEYMREKYLANAGLENKNDYNTVHQALDPYIKDLFRKYSKQIEINTDLFESTKLTDIDVLVIQENVSFPVYVPNFPRLTTYDRLDYGRILEEE
ncbi:MAG: hypothetical protein P8X42_13860 [Calditrichaceae bacterium]